MSSIEGLDELLDELDSLEQDILDAAALGLAKGLKRTVGIAKALCPADSGQLRNSITSVVERKGDTVDGQALATAGHAVYVEMGTGPAGQANHQGVAPVPVTGFTGARRTAGFTGPKANQRGHTCTRRTSRPDS